MWRNDKRNRRRRPLRRIAVEQLEERRLLSAVSWTGSATSFWNNSVNWNNLALPSFADDVNINTRVPTTVAIPSGAAETVNSLTTAAGDTLAITGGTLTINSGGVLAGPVSVSAGTLLLNGNTQFTGGLTVGQWSATPTVQLSAAAGNISRYTIPLVFSPHAGTQTLSFDYSAYFQPSDASSAIPDTFSVYLVQASSGQTLIDRGVTGTALFSVDSRGASTAPQAPGVTVNGSQVSIDVTSLQNSGAATLVFELYNGDGDTAGTVSVSNFQNTIDTSAVETPAAASRLATNAPASMTTDQFGALIQTNNVSVTADNLRFDPTTNLLTVDLQVTNNTGTTLGRDLAVGLENMPPGVQVVGAFGLDGSGNPLIDFQPVIPDLGLPNGQTSGRLTVQFQVSDPAALDFAPTFIVYARTAALEIFNQVRNAYDYQPYYGAMKGAAGVIDTGSGSAWDISTVLIDDLEAGGIQAQYVFDTVQMPVDDVINWVGATNEAGAMAMMQDGGLDPVAIYGTGDQSNSVVAIQFAHCWVTVNLALPGNPVQWVNVDPSFKLHDYQAGVPDIAALVPFDQTDYLSQTQSVTASQYYANQVTQYLAVNMPGTTLGDVPYAGTIIPQTAAALSNADLPFTFDPSQEYETSTLPGYAEYQVIIVIQIPGGALNSSPTDVLQTEISLDQDGREPITVNLGSDTTSITVGSTVVTGGGVLSDSAMNIELGFVDANPNNIEGIVDRVVNVSAVGGQTVGLAFDGGQIGESMLAQQWGAVNQFEQGETSVAPPTMLSAIAMQYLYNLDQAQQSTFALMWAAPHRAAVSAAAVFEGSGAGAGYYPFLSTPVVPNGLVIGAYYGAAFDGGVPIDGSTNATAAANRRAVTSIDSSDQENAIWTQLFNEDGISTTKSIQLANQQGIAVFTITPDNENTYLPQLNLGTQVEQEIQGWLDDGDTVIVPQDDTPLDEWDGVGYIVEFPGNTTGGDGFILDGELSDNQDITTPGGSPTGPPNGIPAVPCPQQVPTGGLPMGAPTQEYMQPATGAMIQQVMDVNLPAVGIPLQFERTYESGLKLDVSLGYNWVDTYSEQIYGVFGGSGAVTWMSSDGRFWTFQSNGDGGYITPVWISGTMTQTDTGWIYTEEDGTEHIFNSAGQLTALIDRYGDGLQLVYNSNNLLSEVYSTVDPTRYLTFGYDDTGHLTSVTDFTGRTWTYTYQYVNSSVQGESYYLLASAATPSDAETAEQLTEYQYVVAAESGDTLAGDISKIIQSDGLAESFTYYASGRLFTDTQPDGGTGTYFYSEGATRYVDPLGIVTIYGLDSIGKVISQSVEEGHGKVSTTLYEWNADNIVQETDPLGHVTNYSYDAGHNLTQEVNAAGDVYKYTYNSYGEETSATDALGNVTTYTYDQYGNLVSETDPLGDVTTYTYDQYGERLSETLPEGNVASPSGDYTTTFTYNSAGQVTSVATALGVSTSNYDPRGDVVSTTDADGNATTYTYDLLDREKSMTDALGQAQYFYYDTLDRLIESVDRLGLATTYAYNRAADNTTTIYADGTSTFEQYDYDGELVESVDELGNATRYAYDDLGDLVKTTYADGGVELQTYDLAGNLLSTTDPLGNKTTYSYDVLNRLVTTTDALGGATTVAYDADGNVVSRTDARGYATTYTYDALDRLLSTTDALGDTTSQAYDADGNLASTTDAAGDATTYAYDVLGDLTSMTDALGDTTSYTYDADGNKISATDADGNTTTYAYDALDRLVSVTDPLGGVTSYGYDADGNRIVLRDALGNVTQYQYDVRGWLAETIDAPGDTTTYGYDADGDLTSVTDALGRVTTYTYNSQQLRTSATNAAGGTTTYAYDLDGNLTSETDPLGNTTRYAYDALNRLTRETNALGGTTSYAYDADGDTTSETDPLGNVTHYAYDALDRLVSTTDALDGTTSQTYDSRGNVVSRTDALDRTTHYAYNALDRLTSETDAAGGVSSWTYDANGNTVTAIDPNDNTTTYAYDALNRLVSTTDAVGDESDIAYDADGNVISRTDARGFATTYAYDALNRLLSTTDPIGGTTSYAYDAVGNLLSTTDALGRVTTYAYDALNRETSTVDALDDTTTYVYDADGNLLSTTDPLGNTTHYAYDALNRQTSAADALGNKTTYVYNADGDLTSVTDPLGNKTSYGYDALNRRTSQTDALGGVTTYAYDAVGNLTSTTDPLGRTASYAYDALNRQISVTDPLGGKTQYAYDADGNKTSTTDADGNTTAYAYDADNRLVSVTDALGGVTSYAYDADGNQTSVTDPLGRTTTYVYDPDDRLAQTTDPMGRVTTYSLDVVGNLLWTVDALDNKTYFSYDALNREVSTTDADGNTTNYQYDADGNLVAVTDPDNNTTTYAYDADNRQTSETTPLGTTTYAYDADGNLVGTTDAKGNTTIYTFDALNRRTKETWIGGGDTFIYAYDADGELLSASDAYSSYTYTYDADGRTTSVSNAGTPGVPTVVFSYTYDANGNLLSRSETIGGAAGATDNYSYDALNRVTRVTQSGNGTTDARVDFGYDADGEQTSITRYADLAGTQLVAATTTTYDADGESTTMTDANGSDVLAQYGLTYDADGHVTQLVGVNGSGDGTTTYTYDAAGQLLTANSQGAQPTEDYSYDDNGNRTGGGYSTGPDNELLSDGTYNYTYDADGNRATRTDIATGQVTTYAYDNRDRLVSVVTRTSAGGSIISQVGYTYDVFNNLIGETVAVTGQAATTVRSVYDGGQVALQFDGGGNLTHRYLYGPAVDQILADQTAAAQILWPLADYEGTIRDVANSSGAVVDHIDYNAFGQVLSQTNAASGTIFGYTGQILDGATGLMDYGARFYDPATGQFVSQDPTGFSAGDSNLYRYVDNDPASVIDPTGLKARTLVCERCSSGTQEATQAAGNANVATPPPTNSTPPSNSVSNANELSADDLERDFDPNDIPDALATDPAAVRPENQAFVFAGAGEASTDSFLAPFELGVSQNVVAASEEDAAQPADESGTRTDADAVKLADTADAKDAALNIVNYVVQMQNPVSPLSLNSAAGGVDALSAAAQNYSDSSEAGGRLVQMLAAMANLGVQQFQGSANVEQAQDAYNQMAQRSAADVEAFGNGIINTPANVYNAVNNTARQLFSQVASGQFQAAAFTQGKAATNTALAAEQLYQLKVTLRQLGVGAPPSAPFAPAQSPVTAPAPTPQGKRFGRYLPASVVMEEPFAPTVVNPQEPSVPPIAPPEEGAFPPTVQSPQQPSPSPIALPEEESFPPTAPAPQQTPEPPIATPGKKRGGSRVTWLPLLEGPVMITATGLRLPTGELVIPNLPVEVIEELVNQKLANQASPIPPEEPPAIPKITGR